MKTALRFCVLGLLALLSACSSDKTGAELRKEGFDAILKNIKPGMYRRQLYALLPPMHKPTAYPPRVSYFHWKGSAPYSDHREEHPLDDECSLEVTYQLKNGKEYAEPRSERDKVFRTKGSSSKRLTPDSIDELLSAAACPPLPYNDRFRAGPLPSRENPDDIIVSVSETLIHTQPGDVMTFGTMFYPTQDNLKFGRRIPPTLPTKRGEFRDLLPAPPKN
jgi:hypothetical protein